MGLAKKVVAEVSPVVNKNEADVNSAAFVFSTNNYLTKPLVAETTVTQTPKSKKQVQKTQTSISKTVTMAASKVSGELTAWRFPYGYCTYYVSQRRFVPWSGNAISWLSGARSYGFATGNVPQVGAIIVTSEGGYTGHVGMVDAVNADGTITISEMNYRGWGVISSRTISTSYSAIRGYIY